MRKSPVLMLLIIGVILVGAYIISYNNHTLHIDTMETITIKK